MAIPVQASFEVPASIEHVWAYFSNPSQVVTCLPGAELLEVLGGNRYRGSVHIKVGPVTAHYLGSVQIEQIDPRQHVMILQARGEQQGAVGRAEARISFSLSSLGEQSTQVSISSEIVVAGRLAQFGSGLIQTASKQLFHKFAECVQNEVVAAGEDPVHKGGDVLL